MYGTGYGIMCNLTRTDNRNVGWTQRAKSLSAIGPAGGLNGASSKTRKGRGVPVAQLAKQVYLPYIYSKV